MIFSNEMEVCREWSYRAAKITEKVILNEAKDLVR